MKQQGKGSSNKASKKPPRKRPDDWKEQAADYARRLCHACRKQMRQQVKQVRQLTCQKVARQVKQQQQGSVATVEKWQRKLQRYKAIPLDVVVDEAVRRLGLPQIENEAATTAAAAAAASIAAASQTTATATTTTQEGPTSIHETATINDDDDNNNNSNNSNNNAKADEWQDMVEKLLAHKRMQQALEKWGAQVAEYRQWCLRHEERQQHSATHHVDSTKSKESTKKKTAKKDSGITTDLAGTHDYSQSVFLTLGGTADESDHEQNKGDDDDKARAVKKNRPGQRSRQAKAMAIQAKQQGRKWDSSVNWRAPKKTHEAEAASTATSSTRTTATKRPNQEPEKETEELHPSWAARKVQKTGISEFKGTRITFD